MDMKLSSRKEEKKEKQKGGRIEICSKIICIEYLLFSFHFYLY
jgi:hypothetical protein